MQDSPSRIHLLISGLVQGVFYRASTQAQAQALGLAGWVRNLPDGRVEVMAEGEVAALEALIDWCGSGPPSARVDVVEARELDASGEFTAFEIRR